MRMGKRMLVCRFEMEEHKERQEDGPFPFRESQRPIWLGKEIGCARTQCTFKFAKNGIEEDFSRIEN